MARPFIAEYMEQYFDEVEPMEFYRKIFPEGLLDPGVWDDEKQRMRFSDRVDLYHGILIDKNVDDQHHRHTYVFDDLEGIRKAVEERRDALLAPILYHDRTRTDENARFITALAFDWDGISKRKYLDNFFHQVKNGVRLMPTYIVCSGNGLHLYFLLDRPCPCFFDKMQELRQLKYKYTEKLWTPLLTEEYEKPQFEALSQPMRLVGGATKDSGVVRVFETGDPVSLMEFGEYIGMVIDPDMKDSTPLSAARVLWPEWYERRVVRKEPRKHWVYNRGLYDRWLERIPEEASFGHRYFALFILSVNAIKSGVPFEELKEDAYALMPILNAMAVEPFTEKDVLAALKGYDERYIRLGWKVLKRLTGCDFPPQKRNGRKQKDHLELARAAKSVLKKQGALKAPDGRPSKKEIVQEWQEDNPDGKKVECIRETGLSKSTVYRHWNEQKEDAIPTAADLERIRTFEDLTALLDKILDKIPKKTIREWYGEVVTFEGITDTRGNHVNRLIERLSE